MRAALELVTPDIEPSYEWRREALLAEAEEPPAILPVPAPPGRYPVMNRDQLEAAIWRATFYADEGTSGGCLLNAEQVDAILAAADAYATREAMIAIEVTS